MTRGKQTCKILKEIRQQIADKNDIAFVTSECDFKGECKGTCPKCEAELKYLEKELWKRTQLGKAVAVAGISLGIVGTIAGCNSSQLQQDNVQIAEQEIVTEIVDLDTISAISPKEPVVWMGTTPEIVDEDEILNKEQITIGEIEDKIVKIRPLAGITFPEDLLKYQEKLEAEAIKIYDIDSVDMLPSFPEGEKAFNKFLVENIVYPRRQKDILGRFRVVVRFIVEKDGMISDVTVTESPSIALSDESVRVIKAMPKWTPAQKDGKSVRCYFILPVEFVFD